MDEETPTEIECSSDDEIVWVKPPIRIDLPQRRPDPAVKSPA